MKGQQTLKYANKIISKTDDDPLYFYFMKAFASAVLNAWCLAVLHWENPQKTVSGLYFMQQ